MADNEKVLPDPIEIEGIRIGDDRFGFKFSFEMAIFRKKGIER